jgi:hypothetical protein
LGVALPEILEVVTLNILFYYIFGVIGINYFKGKFYDCSNPLVKREDPPLTKWECLDFGGHWKK